MFVFVHDVCKWCLYKFQLDILPLREYEFLGRQSHSDSVQLIGTIIRAVLIFISLLASQMPKELPLFLQLFLLVYDYFYFDTSYLFYNYKL